MDSASPNSPLALFRSPLLILAAVFFSAAALAGVFALGTLALPGSIEILMEDLYEGGTASGDALITWSIIHGGAVVIATIWACLLAVSLIRELLDHPGRGMRLLRQGTQGLCYALKGLGILLAVVFVIRFIRYLIITSPRDDGIYLLYAMVISEGLMVSVSVFVFLLLRRFLEGFCRSAASMAYTRLSGKADSVSIPGFAATGCLLLALLGPCCAFERVTTLTIVWALQPYYKLLIIREPVLYLPAALYALSALGNFLMYLFLRRYKRATERHLFKLRSGAPVSDC